MTKAFPMLCLLLLTTRPCWAEIEGGVPLERAVAELNAQAANRDERIDPLTVQEVLKAIREWDREKTPIDDNAYQLFQRILETKMLPPRAEINLSLHWSREDFEDTVQQYVARVQLDVMTGERTGYGFTIRTQKLEEKPYPKTALGYEWIIWPGPAEPTDASADGIVYSIEKDAERSMIVVVGRLSGESNLYDVQAVVFDTNGNRHQLTERTIGQHKNVLMTRFELDAEVVPHDQVASFGFEGLRERGAKYLSELAVREAATKELKVLPIPIVGKKLDFQLVAADGREIDAADLLGNVVLIDCWATWCGPCLKQLPELKRLYEEHQSEGLSVIGLSVDELPAAAERIYETRDIQWPLVTIPNDANARQLWEKSARILSVPRILVVDRSGVLRFDGQRLPLDQILALLDQK